MSGQEPDVQPSPTLDPVADDPSRVGDDPSSEAGFRLLFESTYRPLVAYARRRLNDPADVDDLVSEVFAVAWRRRDELGPVSADGGSALPWLYGVAANVLRNQRRAGHRRLRLVEHIGSEPTALAGAAADPADRPGDELRAALTKLSDDDQEVLRLVAWEGLSHAEVAQVLACSPNAVAIRVHRARKRLAVHLGLEAEAGTATSTDTSTDTDTDTDPREDPR